VSAVPAAEVAGRRLRFEPLWVRVDRNRIQLGIFVVLFVAGSAALLSLALVAVPGALIGSFGAGQLLDGASWFATFPWVVLGCFGVLLVVGGFMAAVQLANAEDWVRSHFGGRPLAKGEAPELVQAVADLTIAAGLASTPQVLVLPDESINAFAIGTNRGRATIGVTEGLLTSLDAGEQRAVVAALAARVVAGDIYFATALAALMGPIKAIRGSRKAARSGGDQAAIGRSSSNDGCSGIGDGCSGCGDIGDGAGCGQALVYALVIGIIIAVTYAAVRTAAWIVTSWARALQRTSHEKSDAEGMLLLRDPVAMLSALRKAASWSNSVTGGDVAYDGIFYVATSGTHQVERSERKRFDRLREVVGAEGEGVSLD
jgi:Zn-dependent protease with chaperone function